MRYSRGLGSFLKRAFLRNLVIAARTKHLLRSMALGIKSRDAEADSSEMGNKHSFGTKCMLISSRIV